MASRCREWACRFSTATAPATNGDKVVEQSQQFVFVSVMGLKQTRQRVIGGAACDPKRILGSAGQLGFLSLEDGPGFAAGWGAATGCGFGAVAKCGGGGVGFKSLGGGAPPSGLAPVFSGLGGFPPFNVV
jgi:hypothetical protein